MQRLQQKRGAVTIIIIIMVGVLVLAGGIYLLTRPTLDTVNNAKGAMAEQSQSVDSMDMGDSSDAATTTQASSSSPGLAKSPQQRTQQKSVAHWVVLAGSASPLYAFNKVDYEEMTKSDKLIVLYFYADWCPFCAVEYPILKDVFNGMTRSDVVGFRVHYNDEGTGPDERALARQFGVGYQHTKVFLKKGERVLKSPESWTKERYLLEIAKF